MSDSRQRRLRRLADESFDLLVIGGGATGCGIALDAAARGIKTALVERGDYAEGTSGRSTKLVHGGVRYLEKAVREFSYAQYRLVSEGLKERSTILSIAPHLAHPLTLVTPIYKNIDIPYTWAGLKLYDALAGSSRLEKSSLLSPKDAIAAFPTLSRANLKGAVRYQDGQFNDCRMAVALVQTAEEEGAVCANYLETVGLNKSGGKIFGAKVRDAITGADFDISAKGVINATGPFADTVRRLDDPNIPPIITASTGVHISLPKSFAPGTTALLIPKTEDGRLLFVIPWEGGVIAGSTDHAATPERRPIVSEEEIDYLLRHLGCYLQTQPVRSDVLSAWSGVRPLVAGTAATTQAIVREHRIEISAGQLITIAGGKWTSYRRMAREAVDTAIRAFGFSHAGPCRTKSLVLAGSRGFRSDGWEALARTNNLPQNIAHHLNDAYGDRAPQLASLCDRGYSALVHPDYQMTEAEVVYSVTEEYAQKPLDILCRRTPLALLNINAAAVALPTVVSLMARELGWTDERIVRESAEALETLKTSI